MAWLPSPLAFAIAGILAASGAAAKEDAGTTAIGGSSVELNEIVVTATRRSERVVDVPYNISAISGADIDEQKIINSADLLRGVSGVSIVDRGYRNSGVINAARIRGINADSAILGDYITAGQSPVSTYVNDTPVYANFLLKDIERVEVLRGPQGTLYGSGALGGTLKYILRKPSFDKFSATIGGSLSRTEGSDGTGWNGDAILNIPVGESLALRLNASRLDLPGIIDYTNIYKLDANGIPVAPKGVLDPTGAFTSKKDADSVKITYGRAALRWKPDEAWDIDLAYIAQKDDIGGRRQRVAPGTPNYAVGGVYGQYDQGAVMLEPSARKVQMTSLEAAVDLGFATLSSSTSYTDHDGESENDNSGFYAHHFLGLYYYYPRALADKHREYTDRDFVEELRLVSNKGGPWDYTAGLFYQRQHINSGETDFIRGFVNWFNAARAADPAFAPFYPPGQLTSERDFFYNRDEKFTSKAVFGELTYHFNDAHQVSLGARYFADEADITTDVAPSLPIFSNEEIHALAPIKQSKPLFKANYSWHMTPDNMLYVTASQGYRRGGANGIPITGLLRERPEWQSYKDDNINNFEVGFKGFNERFSYSATAFLINWKDIQINTATPTWGYYATSNVGSARSKGTELELSGRLAQRWRYTLSFTYIDAQLTSTGYIPSAVTAAAPTVVIAQAGERLPAVPKVLASASTSYRAPVGPAVSFFGTLGVSFQGSQLNALKGDRDNLGVTLGSYSIWNATTGFDFGKWDLTLTAKNLLNSPGVSGVFTEQYSGSAPANNFLGDTSRQLITMPRTVALGFSYRFE